MAILVICEDSPEAPVLRQQYLREHFEYIESILHQLCVAGPLAHNATKDEPGGYDGSCFIYDTNDPAIAEQLLFNDPYFKHGVYSSHRISRFKPAAGEWIGGTVW